MIKTDVTLIRAQERFLTKTSWLNSRHSFSFGPHYDPVNTHHGLLLVSNDDVIKAGTGFMTHPHEDMEIVTWVLDGELEHTDSEGNHGVIYPGLAQRMSAGAGIWHSEMNPSSKRDARLVQMWVAPDAMGANPGYEQLDVSDQLKSGSLTPVASGVSGRGAISIRQKGATLWAARIGPGKSVQLPEAPYEHVYVAKGSIDLEAAGALLEGDAARLVGAGSRKVQADAKTGAEILVWEMDRVI